MPRRIRTAFGKVRLPRATALVIGIHADLGKAAADPPFALVSSGIRRMLSSTMVRRGPAGRAGTSRMWIDQREQSTPRSRSPRRQADAMETLRILRFEKRSRSHAALPATTDDADSAKPLRLDLSRTMHAEGILSGNKLEGFQKATSEETGAMICESGIVARRCFDKGGADSMLCSEQTFTQL